jgi:hypothetical protein
MRLLPLALVWLTVLAPAQQPEDYLRRRNEVMLECAKRHLELGLWCREKGLVREAMGELLLAEELAEGRHPGVSAVLSLQRRFEDAFWKKRLRPSPSATKSYPKKAREAVKEDEDERLDLAAWAEARGLDAEAFSEYESIVRQRGEPLQFDSNGLLVLESAALPEEISRRLRQNGVEINGRLYVRDEFLRHLPEIGAIWEIESKLLRVRSPLGIEATGAIHALGSALLPELDRDFNAQSTRRLDVFVFETRETYETWLASAGLAEYAVVSGFADGMSGTAVICREGLNEGSLQALVLHELTHLYDLSLSRAAMPDWYREGLAEQYGAPGGFEWNEAEQRLRLGGLLEEGLRSALRDSPGSVAEILGFEAIATWRGGLEEGSLGYARCWALVRYLRTAAPAPVRDQFAIWQDQCYGAGLGAVAGDWRARDAQAASNRFRELLGERLKEIEQGYADFIAGL